MAVSISGNSVLAGKTQVGQAFLLDDYRDAAAAYSMRKLRYAYSGSAVRVRRSSDNTEQDIGFDAFGNLDEASLLTFTGANSAYVTKWYDQSTGSQQNLIKYNEQFDNAIWGIDSVTKSSNTTIAPDGNLTADTLTATGTSACGVNQSFSYTSGTFNLSCFIKKGTGFILYLSGGSSGIGAIFNGNTGAYINSSAVGGISYVINSYSCVSYNDYYWNVNITVTTADTGTKYFGVYINQTGGTTWRSGWGATVGDTLTVWGAQLNTGSFPRNYTPTTTATIDSLRDAAQTTAASQPRIVNAGVVEKQGNKPIISFYQEFTHALNIGTQINLQTSFYFSFVGNSSSSYSNLAATFINYQTSSADNPELRFGGDTNGSKALFYLNGGYVINSSVGLNNYKIHTLTSTSGVTMTFYGNGTQLATGTRSGIFNNCASFEIGKYTGFGYRSGQIQELVIYNSDKSSVRTGIEKNINEYFKIY